MIFSKTPCAAAGVYTQNLVKGAPILVTRKNIADGRAQAVICNSGNANTAMPTASKRPRRMCELAAAALGIDPGEVIVASTGVIGQVLPSNRLRRPSRPSPPPSPGTGPPTRPRPS